MKYREIMYREMMYRETKYREIAVESLKLVTICKFDQLQFIWTLMESKV